MEGQYVTWVKLFHTPHIRFLIHFFLLYVLLYKLLNLSIFNLFYMYYYIIQTFKSWMTFLYKARRARHKSINGDWNDYLLIVFIIYCLFLWSLWSFIFLIRQFIHSFFRMVHTLYHVWRRHQLWRHSEPFRSSKEGCRLWYEIHILDWWKGLTFIHCSVVQ